MSWMKLIFRRKNTENFIIWRFGKNFFSRERIQRTLWSDHVEEAFFSRLRLWKLFDLMIRNNLLFKRIDTEKVTIWWLGRILFQDKGTGNAMIWQVGISLFSIEEILKLVCSDDLEKLIFERKHTEIFRIRCLEKGYFQEERYRERCDMMISRNFFFKRMDSK